MCVGATHMWKSVNSSRQLVSPSTEWVSGIEVRPAGLTAGAFTHRAIPPALDGSSVRLAALTLTSRIIYILPSLEDWFGATF